MDTARALLDEGQASVNLVAAIPSLHAGLSLAIALFLWNRIGRRWRPVLVAYVLTMAFTLVYSAEHYVIDILLGWTLAVAVTWLLSACGAAGLGDGPDSLHFLNNRPSDVTLDGMPDTHVVTNQAPVPRSQPGGRAGAGRGPHSRGR